MNIFFKTSFCFISWFKIEMLKGFNACCHEIKDCVDLVKRAKHKGQMLEKEVDALNVDLAILKIGPNFKNNEKWVWCWGLYNLCKETLMPNNAFLKNSRRYSKHFKQSTRLWQKRFPIVQEVSQDAIER